MKRRKTGFAWLTTLAFFFTAIGTDRAQAETAELRIAYQHSMAFLVVDVMLGKKLIEARAAAGMNTLKVSAVRFTSGPVANDALLKGDVEVGGAGVAPFLDLWAKTRGGANVRGIAPINNSPLYLISTDARIQTPKDLTSADKVAVPAPGSIQGLFLRMHAAMASMTSPDAIKALASPESGVRNYVGSIPFNLSAMALPGAREVANSYDLLGGPHTLVLLFVTEKFKTENPKTFAVLAAAIEDAMAFIKIEPARDGSNLCRRFERRDTTRTRPRRAWQTGCRLRPDTEWNHGVRDLHAENRRFESRSRNVEGRILGEPPHTRRIIGSVGLSANPLAGPVGMSATHPRAAIFGRPTRFLLWPHDHFGEIWKSRCCLVAFVCSNASAADCSEARQGVARDTELDFRHKEPAASGSETDAMTN
jgi:NitT/TauT family transport system substrate-binding protein